MNIIAKPITFTGIQLTQTDGVPDNAQDVLDFLRTACNTDNVRVSIHKLGWACEFCIEEDLRISVIYGEWVVCYPDGVIGIVSKITFDKFYEVVE